MHLTEDTIRVVTFDADDGEITLRSLLETGDMSGDAQPRIEFLELDFPVTIECGDGLLPGFSFPRQNRYGERG